MAFPAPTRTQQLLRDPRLHIGMSMMEGAGPKPHPVGLGAGITMGLRNAQEAQELALREQWQQLRYAQSERTLALAEKREQRAAAAAEREEERRQEVEAYIAGLPEEEQALARLAPQQYVAGQFRAPTGPKPSYEQSRYLELSRIPAADRTPEQAQELALVTRKLTQPRVAGVNQNTGQPVYAPAPPLPAYGAPEAPQSPAAPPAPAGTPPGAPAPPAAPQGAAAPVPASTLAPGANPQPVTVAGRTWAPGTVVPMAGGQYRLTEVGKESIGLAGDRQQWQVTDAKGVQPFGPATPAPTGEELKVQAQRRALQNTYDVLDNYRRLLAESGGGEWQGFGTTKADLLSAYNAVVLELKSAAELGVLAGPDMDIIEQTLVRPDSFTGAVKGALGGTTTATSTAQQVADYLQRKYRSLTGGEALTPTPDAADPTQNIDQNGLPTPAAIAAERARRAAGGG